MNIVIVGTGYVGLVTGACLAQMGINVYCVDVDESKIDKLNDGQIPIYEPGLEELVESNVREGRLHFTTDLKFAIAQNIDIVFSAVGTPPREDGSADLKYVLEVASQVGKSLENYIVFVTKSTVPVGTAAKVKEAVQFELDKRGVSVDFDVASNPEFLKEGSAIEDFMKPDRVVIGVDSQRAKEMMTSLYKPMLVNNFRVLFMDIASAEMAKYAANSMLALRISFMNEVAALCEKMGADIDNVRRAIGTDARIGSKFLYAGCGYGGSCFPKDVKALIKTGKENSCQMHILEATENVNEKQKKILFEKFKNHFNGDIKGKKVALWGLSFKPDTDDMREAPSLVLIEDLLKYDCQISAYDPIAMDECEKIIGQKIKYCKDIYECAKQSDVIFHITEWRQFRFPDWDKIKSLAKKDFVLIDGRNNLISAKEENITYIGIGKNNK